MGWDYHNLRKKQNLSQQQLWTAGLLQEPLPAPQQAEVENGKQWQLLGRYALHGYMAYNVYLHNLHIKITQVTIKPYISDLIVVLVIFISLYIIIFPLKFFGIYSTITYDLFLGHTRCG